MRHPSQFSGVTKKLWQSLEEGCWKVRLGVKLQAPEYHILPPATAITDQAIKYFSGNCQLTNSFSLVLKWRYVCNRQLKLYQALIIIIIIIFFNYHIAYTSTNKNENRLNGDNSFFFSFFFFFLLLTRGGRTSCIRACLDALLLLQFY